MAKVSVIIAAYNEEAYIGRAVDSVLAQTYSDLELIVVDDLSSDNTVRIVEDYCAKDRRVRLLRHDTNNGSGAARNTALRQSSGEWVAILDGDDWYLPDRLETLLGYAVDTGAPLIADNQYLLREPERETRRTLRESSPLGVTQITAHHFLLGDRMGRPDNLGLLKPFVKRNLLAENSIEYYEHRGLGEDFYFTLNCIKCAGHLDFFERPMYYYYIHEGSRSTKRQLYIFEEMKLIHDNYAGLFDPTEFPQIADLMERRGRQISRYIGVQRIAMPLKSRHLGQAIGAAASNPGSIPMFVTVAANYLARRVSLGVAGRLFR